MVLLIAVVLGLFCGFLRAKLRGNELRTIRLRSIWLVFAAFIPQFFAFIFYPTQRQIPDSWIPFILVGSQALLLVFAWLNRKEQGFWLLGLGLLLNFLVIVLNGGFMPLPPENADRLIAPGSGVILEVGERVGLGKDILLQRGQTRLWFLGDIFMLPEWLNYPLAFSLGDILIATGAFWLLWELGRPRSHPKEVSP
jgi:hypothetical protein